MKLVRNALNRLERNGSGHLEDRVRDYAASMFGTLTMKHFLAKCLYDLVVLSNSHECPHEDLVTGESKLEEFAIAHFVDFVKALYQDLRSRVSDPSNILENNPWVVECEGKEEEIVIANIKACGGLLNNSQNGLKKRILIAFETNNSVISPFRRSAGPGLAIIVWLATGEFLGEIEIDCRGKVDLIQTTHRAVVMGAEIKTSASDIGRAKLQLIRRFKIIATCLNVIYNIKQEDSIFVGRVFYRYVQEGSSAPSAEDGSGNDLVTLSFYYHRV